MTLAEDTILENRYRIDRLLTHGGHGAVYRAFDMSLNTPVAIKENFLTSERITQFKQEALILAQLRHSALPRVTHQFSLENQQYLVMDFIEGENLWELVKSNGGPLEEAEALEYIIQICQALSYLHQQAPPIIHRDIKPQNIIITPKGQAVLVDFGITRQIFDEVSYAQSGAQGVIPRYSAPEQYSGTGTNPTSDVYSLGATLYAVLTGEEPPNSITRLAEDVKLKPPDAINPKLNAKTAQAIVYAMQLKPEDRPQSASHFLQILETLVETISPPQQRAEADTLATQATSPPRLKETSVSTQAESTFTPTHYWLVDSRGLGYPLGLEPLTIGSHPQTDVLIEDEAVSPFHARVRTEGSSCFILDEETPQGTFLNGHRLRSEWYPFNQGDIVVVGPTRFYLTTTQPARLAPLKPRAMPVPQDRFASASALASQAIVSPPVPTKSRGISRFILAFFVVAAMIVGVSVYLLLNPAILISLGVPFSNQTDPASQQALAPDQTQTAAAVVIETLEAAVQSTAQAQEDAEAIRQVESAEATHPTQENETAQASQKETPTPETIPIPTHTATPTSPPIININTLVPTQAIPTTIPTGIPTRRVTPTISGPTLIPLESRVSIDRIGVQEVIDVDINPKNPREVYALVKRDGIYKSSNGGDSPWARIDLDGSAITAFVIDPTDPTQLYAATWNAVLKSTDGGNTWDPKTDGLLANRVVDVMAIHPSNPELIYAGIGETLVASTNGGESWTSQGYGAGLGIGRLYTIVIDPFNNDTIYVGGLAATIYKSTDSGQSFSPLVNTGKGTFSIAAHPTQRDVYLAGINSGEAGIIKTENGFEFESVSTGLIYGGADSAYSAITYAPSNPNIVYAGSGYESNPDSKGIFKSSNGGETWESINIGLNINRDTGFPYYVKSIMVHPGNPDILFAATGSGLYKSTDGGANWNLK